MDAISMVARMHGLHVGRRGATVLVGSRRAVDAIVVGHQIRVFQVHWRSAESLVPELQRQFPGYVVTADPTTNCVIVATPPDVDPPHLTFERQRSDLEPVHVQLPPDAVR